MRASPAQAEQARQQAFYRSALRRRRKVRRMRILGSILLLLMCVSVFFLVRGCMEEVPEPPKEPDSIVTDTAEVFHTSYVMPTSPPYVIAMDAGHGGDDIGATGIIGEVELTETTVYHLNGWLKNDENYTPVYCRPDGAGSSIADRAKAAADAGAHLLLSIHGNSSDDAGVSGFECFPVPPGRNLYAPSLQFAQLLASGMQTGGQFLRGQQGVRYVYYADNGAGGYEKYIVEESDRTVREDKSFGLLEQASCPAVLVEQCFLTSEVDVEAWGRTDGCARAARIYYEAICAYFGTQPLPQAA